ncbi:hypothetical protein TEA_017157 [Camellia sinensis var. sinensis]|uniref:Uncharacterized protein n=1 Tax=Camellia sinensis var. sinensis TaxID=542762 RepID=A0A4S4ENE9_CAMSN|nr:hypothetical protein TEA_017157 [Camellia sinensis var. sinensis]
MTRTRDTSADTSMSPRPRIVIQKLCPHSLPPSDPNATHDVAALYGSVRRNFLTPFRNLLAKLNDDDNATPAVTCIVSDGVMPFSIKVADELRIPVAMFWTFAACGFMGFYQYYALLDKGLTPLKGTYTTPPPSLLPRRFQR